MSLALRKSRCFVSPPIRQALARDGLKDHVGALRIRAANGSAVVVAEVKLADVALEYSDAQGGPAANGMSLRDYFAIHAPEPDERRVQSAEALDRARNPHNDGPPKPPLRSEHQIRSELRYQYADAMLKAREQSFR